MRTLLILAAWTGVVALVFSVGFGSAGLLRDASVGTLGLGLLGAAACTLQAQLRWG